MRDGFRCRNEPYGGSLTLIVANGNAAEKLTCTVTTEPGGRIVPAGSLTAPRIGYRTCIIAV